MLLRELIRVRGLILVLFLNRLVLKVISELSPFPLESLLKFSLIPFEGVKLPRHFIPSLHVESVLKFVYFGLAFDINHLSQSVRKPWSHVAWLWNHLSVSSMIISLQWDPFIFHTTPTLFHLVQFAIFEATFGAFELRIHQLVNLLDELLPLDTQLFFSLFVLLHDLLNNGIVPLLMPGGWFCQRGRSFFSIFVIFSLWRKIGIVSVRWRRGLVFRVVLCCKLIEFLLEMLDLGVELVEKFVVMGWKWIWVSLPWNLWERDCLLFWFLIWDNDRASKFRTSIIIVFYATRTPFIPFLFVLFFLLLVYI